MSNPTAPAARTALVNLSDADRAVLKDDAATARKDGRLEISTAPVWDTIVKVNGNGKGTDGGPKRAAILRAVLTEAGEWKTTPQVDADKVRTPFGNVVQKFGARFDAAVKRATPEAPKPVTLRATLSGEGGGSVTIPPNHALYAQITAMIAAEQQ